MNRQDFVSELEQRCDIFRNAYRSKDAAVLRERDHLIDFAKSSIIARAAPLSEAQQLVAFLRQNISLAA